MEMDSAIITEGLKDVETNLLVVDLFKYSLISISFHIRPRTNLTLWSPRKKRTIQEFKTNDDKYHKVCLRQKRTIQEFKTNDDNISQSVSPTKKDYTRI